MRRNKFRLRKLKYYNIIFSSVCGTALTAALILIFAYVGSKADISAGVISVMLSLSVSAGGFFSGYLYGRRKRHKGILSGILCGVILYGVVFFLGIVYLRGFPPLRLVRYLIIISISGAAGGVTGVNSPIKRPPF